MFALQMNKQTKNQKNENNLKVGQAEDWSSASTAQATEWVEVTTGWPIAVPQILEQNGKKVEGKKLARYGDTNLKSQH